MAKPIDTIDQDSLRPSFTIQPPRIPLLLSRAGLCWFVIIARRDDVYLFLTGRRTDLSDPKISSFRVPCISLTIVWPQKVQGEIYTLTVTTDFITTQIYRSDFPLGRQVNSRGPENVRKRNPLREPYLNSIRGALTLAPSDYSSKHRPTNFIPALVKKIRYCFFRLYEHFP